MNNYFSHDSNARNDEKLVRLRMTHKAAGYGVYFMLLERMREAANYICARDYDLIAFELHEDAALIKSVIEDFGLFVFTDDGKYFYSESFLRRMGVMDDITSKRSEAGKAGNRKRWRNAQDNSDLQDDNAEELSQSNRKPIANVSQNHRKAIANVSQSNRKPIAIKENKIKENKTPSGEGGERASARVSTPSASAAPATTDKEVEQLLSRLAGGKRFDLRGLVATWNEEREQFPRCRLPALSSADLASNRKRYLSCQYFLNYMRRHDLFGAHEIAFFRQIMCDEYLNGRSARRKTPVSIWHIFTSDRILDSIRSDLCV